MLYDWNLADRVHCTKAEKKKCLELIEELLQLGHKMHESGMLALEEDIRNMPKSFLRTALILGQDENEPKTIRDTLEKRLLLSDGKGVELLQRIIEMEFVVHLVSGHSVLSLRSILCNLLDMDPQSLDLPANQKCLTA